MTIEFKNNFPNYFNIMILRMTIYCFKCSWNFKRVVCNMICSSSSNSNGPLLNKINLDTSVSRTVLLVNYLEFSYERDFAKKSLKFETSRNYSPSLFHEPVSIQDRLKRETPIRKMWVSWSSIRLQRPTEKPRGKTRVIIYTDDKKSRIEFFQAWREY